MKRLTNGLIFGLGLGLITMASRDLSDGYSISAVILGAALIITASSLGLKSAP